MSEKEYVEKLNRIKTTHIRIEKILQTEASKVSMDICSTCTSPCCKIDFCKESVESKFLRFVLGEKVKLYSKNSGWMTSSGCSLPYGRSLLCYEFFCDRFNDSRSVDSLKLFSRTLKMIYAKTSKNQHMLVLKDLRHITAFRLDKLVKDLEKLEQQALRSFGISQEV